MEKGQSRTLGCAVKQFLLRWWFCFPLLGILSLLLSLYAFSQVPSFLDNVCAILLIISLATTLSSWVVLLMHRKWWQAVLSVVVALTSWAILLPIVSFAAMSAPDGFGAKHKIPEGLAYELPSDSGEVIASDTSTYLQVSGEAGSYCYSFYYTGLPAGKIFLKCFEATENIPLSEDRIPERSAVSVGSTEGFPFHQMVDHQCFTIYEGDYEDYYAARMEVWFRDSLSGAERKLTEKVYRVDGWMR